MSPGPCEYSPKVDVKGSFFGDAPRFTFHGDKVSAQGSAEREVRETPGPGSYGNSSAIGQQRFSTKKSQPSYGFGTSDREKASRVSYCHA